jgi:hypothetical protein
MRNKNLIAVICLFAMLNFILARFNLMSLAISQIPQALLSNKSLNDDDSTTFLI